MLCYRLMYGTESFGRRITPIHNGEVWP